VSGGAFGIDAVAHRGALAGGGVSVIVSAGGLDQPYPRANARLFDAVAESGLLISERPPGSAPHRHRFLTRNRLIAAFSAGTVVVEAAARSGALNTAAHCQVLGRALMAVPGPVTSAMSVGCHQLLRREVAPAVLVTGVQDVLAIVGSMGEGLGGDARGGTGLVRNGLVGNGLVGNGEPVGADAQNGAVGAVGAVDELRARLDRLDPVARRVFDGLPARRAVREEELAALSGVSALEVLRALPVLQLADLVALSDGGYRMATSARRTRR
jgi:DNA processing protein